MKALEIEELIEKVEISEKKLYLVKVEDTGYIELKKSQVLTILKNEFTRVSLDEFREWLLERNQKYNQLAGKLSIHPVKFTQMMSGHLKSTKSIGNTLDFIKQVKRIVIIEKNNENVIDNGEPVNFFL